MDKASNAKDFHMHHLLLPWGGLATHHPTRTCTRQETRLLQCEASLITLHDRTAQALATTHAPCRWQELLGSCRPELTGRQKLDEQQPARPNRRGDPTCGPTCDRRTANKVLLGRSHKTNSDKITRQTAGAPSPRFKHQTARSSSAEAAPWLKPRRTSEAQLATA